jgi:hypothetical protein
MKKVIAAMSASGSGGSAGKSFDHRSYTVTSRSRIARWRVASSWRKSSSRAACAANSK